MSNSTSDERLATGISPGDRVVKGVRRASWMTVVSVGIVGLLLGGVVGWAGVTVLTPPNDVLATPTYTTIDVIAGEVGSSVNLNTTASWSLSPVGLNGADGVVTSVDVVPGDAVSLGQRLYSVGLRPVVLGQGSIPAYGAIQEGDAGAQVAQLQQFLRDLGYFTGSPNGRFAAGTQRAVEAWQRAAGYPVDGVVQQSDIVWVPSAPARIVLESEVIATGLVISPGEGEVAALSPVPEFIVPLTASQALLVPQGAQVVIEAPDGGQWMASVVSQEPDPEAPDTVNAVLTGGEAGSICAESCAQIPALGQTLLTSEVVTVPAVQGLVVPTAAIVSDPTGATLVVTAEGDRAEVTVVQTARGMSVVEGIAEGSSVRIPAGPE